MSKILMILWIAFSFCRIQAYEQIQASTKIKCQVANSKVELLIYPEEFFFYEIKNNKTIRPIVGQFYLCGRKLEKEYLEQGICEINRSNYPNVDIQSMTCYILNKKKREVFGQVNYSYMPRFNKYRFTCSDPVENKVLHYTLRNCKQLL